MEPKATHRQETLIRTLKEMLNRPTFAEQWPDTHKQAFKNGNYYQKRLDVIRQDKLTIEKIYGLDSELIDYWIKNYE
jgi:hypothetical protein